MRPENITINGFSSEGKWYKGNLHCHTDQSDGVLSPAAVSELYRKNGYQFLCISDHERFADYTKELNKEDFILLPDVYKRQAYGTIDTTYRRKTVCITGTSGRLGKVGC